MGTHAAAGGVQSICPHNNLNSFHCIIIKLYENVCWQNILAKFANQPDPIKHFGMALELAKMAKIYCVWSVTWIFVNRSSINFVTLFVSIISWPSLITSQIPWSTLELWPLNYPKLPCPLCNLIFFQWIIIKLGVSNLVIMFVGIISPPHSINSQISWSTLELWPLFSRNCLN